MIKNIVFDFDGTIADSKDEILKIIDFNSRKYGLGKLNEKRIKIFRTKGAKELILNMKVPGDKLQIILKEIRKQMAKNIENFKVHSGMQEALSKMDSKKLTMGILTTNSKTNVKKFLVKNNINFFNYVYHCSELFGKDVMIQKMLKKQKLKKEETIYIGDEDRDVLAAKKAGIQSAGITWGFGSKELLKSVSPDYIIDTPSELLEIIKA